MGLWLGLIAGNSKLHWGQFKGDCDASFQRNCLNKTWDTSHLTKPLQLFGVECPQNTPVYFASVVPGQSKLIAQYGNAREITLQDLPLGNLYPTLGIDRALALLGAGDRYGYPVLVIDGGTAITLTGADGDRNLVGGAILPGLQLQFDSLGLGTAALPQLDAELDPDSDSTKLSAARLPERWALSTEGAIASGILHNLASGILAFVTDWLERYPNSVIITTGGSGPWLAAQLAEMPQVKGSESDLGFGGISAWRQQRGEPES